MRPHAITFDPAEGRTRTDMQDQCDINKILGQYRRHGIVSHLNERAGSYGDFTNVSDYLSASLAVKAAGEAFNRLPARVRDFCGNDPATFLAALEDPEAVEQMAKLGLKTPAKQDQPNNQQPSSPAPTAPSSPAAGPSPGPTT